MKKYNSASDSLRPGQLNKLVAKIKDKGHIEKENKIKYIIVVNTKCNFYTEQREYNTKKEVIKAIKILLDNFIMIDNIKIRSEK